MGGLVLSFDFSLVPGLGEFWSRSAKMAFSLPRSLFSGVMYPMAECRRTVL